MNAGEPDWIARRNTVVAIQSSQNEGSEHRDDLSPHSGGHRGVPSAIAKNNAENRMATGSASGGP